MAERTRIAIGILSVGFGAAGASFAQSSAQLPVDLAECVNLESADERFACYEAQVQDVLEERDATPVSPPADADEPRRAAEETARERGATDEERSDSAEVIGTITGLRERLPDSYVITLDNGQVWEQVRPKWYPLRPGLKVRIYPTVWGSSLRLTAVDGNGYIQVQRAN